MKPNRMKVTELKWDGDHDALNAGFHVTLECGHKYWRPTNILAARGTRMFLESDGAVCREGCTKTDGKIIPHPNR
jgi:hypothetical protein